MTLTLELQATTSIPLELEGITPDRVRQLSVAEIERLEIFEGNRKLPLGEFFSVRGSAEDESICLQGDCSGVHWIGTKMQSGSIRIEGSAGRHVGSEMSGGTIEVHGDVGDWVGAEMVKGTIHVRGGAGHLVGAAYRGSARGMRGGTILVEGDAGNEVGHTMRRGMIAIGGSAGDLIGFNMLAGTILIGSSVGIRHGAGMRRGTLIFLADEPPELLPTFAYSGEHSPPMMHLLQRQLEALGYPQAAGLSASFDLYHGDQIEGGRGEVLIRAARA